MSPVFIDVCDPAGVGRMLKYVIRPANGASPGRGSQVGESREQQQQTDNPLMKPGRGNSTPPPHQPPSMSSFAAIWPLCSCLRSVRRRTPADLRQPHPTDRQDCQQDTGVEPPMTWG